MKILFSKNATKFLETITDKEKEKIRRKIKELFTAISENGVIPFRILNIKALDGNWKGFLRMRIGKLRIIFKIDKQNDNLLIYEIDFRGNIYK